MPSLLRAAKGPTRHSFKNGKVVFAPVPILQPGEKAVFKIVCKAVKTGTARNTATLKYDQFDKPIHDEEGTSLYK